MSNPRGQRVHHTHCYTCGVPLTPENEYIRKMMYADGPGTYQDCRCKKCFMTRIVAKDRERRQSRRRYQAAYPQYRQWLKEKAAEVRRVSQ